MFLESLTGSMEQLLNKTREQNALLVDESAIDYTGRSCGKIGLTKNTIITHKNRCSADSRCLTNQILDMKATESVTKVLSTAKISEEDDNINIIRPGLAASSLQIELHATGLTNKLTMNFNKISIKF